MAVRLQFVRAGLGLLCVGVLVTACQTGEPDPIPTATLPTPTLPSEPAPTPSPSPDEGSEEQEAANTASFAYFQGRQLANEIYSSGDTDRLSELEPYFTGEYLEYFNSTMRESMDQGFRPNGVGAVGVAVASPLDEEGDQPALQILACLDNSGVLLLDSNGQEAQDLDPYVIETVQMTLESDAWKAQSSDAAPVASFDGSDCEGQT